ncbi:hypothetical protein [Daejeonia sp. YH14]|uniref:hypothetical protein n=1 Tax=Daejeonia sp. YH14 TaxID=3439042 RepID=UPI003F4970A0
MRTKLDFRNEINTIYQDCKDKLKSFSDEVQSLEDLGKFYDKSLQEFYKFMPYYSFYIYKDLSYEDCLELNGYGLEKSGDLHKYYSYLYKEKCNEFNN